MTNYITEFGSKRFAPLFKPCTDSYGCGDPKKTDWPNNVLSAHLKVYDSGVIARGEDPVVHRVDPDELARCERLSAEALAHMGKHPVGMKSEGDDPFKAYFQVVSVAGDGKPPGPPEVVDATLVRALFGKTIAPFEHVFVEPLTKGGFFWREALESEDDEVMGRWEKLIGFFEESDELVKPSFASIGFYEYEAPEGASLLSEEEPPGFEMKGSCLPRMPFAFTRAGSLVGLFGHVVWT